MQLSGHRPDHRRFRRVAQLAACFCALTAAPSTAAGDFVAPPPAGELSPAQAQRAWTPERIAAAPPLELEPGGELRTEPPQPQLFSAAPAARSEHPIGARRYPNRVHGKLVGTFPGLGDFGCSATVV